MTVVERDDARLPLVNPPDVLQVEHRGMRRRGGEGVRTYDRKAGPGSLELQPSAVTRDRSPGQGAGVMR